MARIHLLPPLVQNQIAAGEVVERPVSIVKELIENSLDAGATSLIVSLEEGGKKRISVQDNGSGLAKEDLLLACERHATSKITSLEDLQHIASMGFRGEALASIASVSRLTITTRTAESPLAYRRTILGGTDHPVEETAGTVGTLVEVEDLFYNVPARQKYLRSAKTELGLIMRYITEVAILSPALRLEVRHEGRTTALFPAATPEERMRAALGHSFLETHLPIEGIHPDVQITGYISKPHVQQASRAKQYLFVNLRPIKSDILQKAVGQAYHRIVDEGKYPSLVLFLTVHPTLVDVNVHPRKLEVRFHDPHFLFSLISSTLQVALTKAGGHLVLSAEQSPTAPPASQHPTPTVAYNPLSRATSPYASASSSRAFSGNQRHLESVLEAAPLRMESPKKFGPDLLPTSKAQEYRILGQLLRCYIVLETPEGLLLVDQHAAHERVLFDRLTANIAAGTAHVQALLTPEVLHVTPEERVLLEEHSPLLQEAGFHVEPLDTSSWVLSSLPADLPAGKTDLHATVHSLLGECEDMSTGCASSHLSSYREKLHAYTACRSAVKFGDELTMAEMTALMEDFWKTPRRYTCPHGRTSMVSLERSHLARLFDR